MSYEQTIEKMKSMHLHGMARSFQSTSEMGFTKITPDELVGMLIDAEHDERTNKKFARLLKTAKLRYRASMEHIDFQSKRNLDKNMLMRFATNTWIDKKQNMLITGPTGCGKSYVACALGHNACIHGRSVAYFNSSKLFKSLKLSSADGSYLKEINRMKKFDLLIIDDFGLEPFDKQSRLSLLEIIEDRYDEKSTVFTSQFPVSNWHEMIGEKTIADAICDRLLHSAYRIELKGESLRKKFAEVLT